MYKVGIIGPESTGKSTLAQYLANRYNGLYISEYAREYMENLCNAVPHSPDSEDFSYTYDDVVAIARYQVEQLQTLSTSSEGEKEKLLFFDTELIITKVWFDVKFGRVPNWLEEALRTYPMDIYLLTYPDIAWVPDPVRENPDIRLELFNRYEREIQSLNLPYYIIKH